MRSYRYDYIVVIFTRRLAQRREFIFHDVSA